MPVQLQSPICALLVLVLKPGQSTVQLSDFHVQPPNVLLAIPQQVAAAGQQTEVSQLGLIVGIMSADSHKKVGGGLQITLTFLKPSCYLPKAGRIPNNQPRDMILEIDLHGTENGLQEGKELVEVKLTGVKWIRLIALLAIEDSIRGGHDRYSIRFKHTAYLMQKGLLATQMLDQLKTDHHIHTVAGQRQAEAVANQNLDIFPRVLFFCIANRFFRNVNCNDLTGLFRQDNRAIAHAGADVQNHFVLHQKLGEPVATNVLVQKVGIHPSGDDSLAGKFHLVPRRPDHSFSILIH